MTKLFRAGARRLIRSRSKTSGPTLAERLAGPKLLRAFAESHTEALFVEIGSNDGEQHDHLRPLIAAFPWRGVMVEPVPYVFRRLQHNYASFDRVALENVAIADHDGSLPFYHLREARPGEVDALPAWYDGIGSFSPSTVLSHARHIQDIGERLVTTMVPCLTFESLCDKHRIERLDLLLIDTEGYDDEIIKLINFDRHSPRLLVFEHFHLSEARRDTCRETLSAAGYELMEEGFDTWCLGPDATPELRQVWSALEPAVPALTADAPPSD